ncbi:protein phosphatase 1 regulatory subunit 3G [Sceloporus undulatus]|uniref:protein phosphatase 1 regulatory subunit 3G n=1 Tax=Sceloporus undulatus TaxID=8520 RepID=UPI001C4A97F3|nr:protein phosphatase 1 regulatory subunit 3G [Sceloporus undulatus]
MESRGGFAVLGLGQQVVPPFCQEQKPEEEEDEEDVFSWPGEGRRGSLGSHEGEGQEETVAPSGVIEAAAGGECFPSEDIEEEEGGKEAALLELRRRRGRSFSLPSSPSLARVFPDVGAEDEEEEEAASPSCCTKCKKRVQFADSLGLCLASVKHFSAAEEPQVPPSVLSRLQSFPIRKKDLEGFGGAVWAGLGGGGGGGGCLAFSAAAAPPPPRMAAPSTVMAPSSSSSQTPLRLQPRPEGAVEEAMPRVSLEEVSGAAVSGAPCDVRGVVRVQRCPGPKEVTVRYTFNEWLSFLDANATPAASDDDDDDSKAPAASPSERYQFALCLPPGLDRGTAVHFAICYRSQQGEFWDNNGGANYTLRSAQEGPQG